MIYLDEAATTKPKKEVLDTIYSYMDMWYNPSSLYSPAQEAANALKSAKETGRSSDSSSCKFAYPFSDLIQY